MNIEIRYQSKTGNTEKLANAISEELKVPAKPITEELTENIDILFLGGALYGFDLDPEMKKFINKLDNTKTKKVAIFTTSSIKKNTTFNNIKKVLEEKNITVLDDNFYCKGEYKFLNKNKPDSSDLKNIKEFAHKIIAQNSN